MLKRLWLVSCAWFVATGTAHAQRGAEAEPPWHERLTLSGDLRLRYEGFDWPGHFDDGSRHRFRYRARLGLTARVHDDLRVGMQVRSGEPSNPTSDNQSLDEGFSKKPLAIAEAWVAWKPAGFLTLTAGKFSPAGSWSASDLEWDDDTVAEGAVEALSWRPGGVVSRLDVRFYQYLLEESGSGPDSYMFGQQLASSLALGSRHDLTLGAAYEAVTHPERVTDLYFDGDLISDAGHVTNLVDPTTREPVSDFRVGSLFLELRSRALAGWPLRLTLYLYENFGAGSGQGSILSTGGDRVLATGRGEDHATGWFGRLQVGDHGAPGKVSVRLSRYDTEPDAVFFAFTQSDTARASNVDAYRLDVRVGLPAGSHLNLTGYRSRWNLGEDTAMKRWQLDYVVEF